MFRFSGLGVFSLPGCSLQRFNWSDFRNSSFSFCMPNIWGSHDTLTFSCERAFSALVIPKKRHACGFQTVVVSDFGSSDIQTQLFSDLHASQICFQMFNPSCGQFLWIESFRFSLVLGDVKFTTHHLAPSLKPKT